MRVAPSLLASLRPGQPGFAFGLLYVGQFLFLGIQLPFFSSWLDAHDYSPEAIAGLVTSALVLRLVFATPIAFWAERLPDPRVALVVAAWALFAVAVIVLSEPPRALLTASCIAALFIFGLIVPLTDSAVLRADRQGILSYGPVRGIGSASFVAANLGGGVIIALTSTEMILVLMAGAALLTGLAASALPKADPADDAVREPPKVAEAVTLFRSPRFLYLLVGAGLVQASHAAYYSFSVLHWQLEYGAATIGSLWTVGVLAEIVLMAKAKALLGRFGPTGLLLMGAGAAALRWTLIASSPPLWALLPIQLLHAGTFAATYIGTVDFVGQAVPDRYRTTAMTLISTFGIGAMSGVATTAASTVFTATAPGPAYLMMSGAGLLGGVLLWRLRQTWDGGTLNAVAAAEAATSNRGAT